MRNKNTNLPTEEWKCARCGTWNNKYRTECRQLGCQDTRIHAEKWRTCYESGVTVDL